MEESSSTSGSSEHTYFGREEIETRPGEVDRSEGFFRTLVESRSGIMLLFGRDGIIQYASPSIGDLTGEAPERILGDSVWDMLHPEDRKDVEAVISSEGSAVRSRDFRLRSGDGKWVAVRGSVQGFLDDPRLNGVVLVGREVSQSADEARRRELDDYSYHTIFDAAPIGLARVGPEGRWLRVNRTLCEMLGYEREEMIGRTFQEITHSDDLVLDMKTMEDLLSGRESAANLEKRYVKKDFSVVWVNIFASLFRAEDGEPLYFACVIQDISRAVRARRISATLNQRELDILDMLGHGRTNQQIAHSLNLSLSSAKVYVRRVVEKLSATDRTHAAVRAARLGLIPDRDEWGT